MNASRIVASRALDRPSRDAECDPHIDCFIRIRFQITRGPMPALAIVIAMFAGVGDNVIASVALRLAGDPSKLAVHMPCFDGNANSLPLGEHRQ